MLGLVAAYLWGKDRARRRNAEWDGGETLLAFLLVPVALLVCMPYLVWVAVRDNGQGRWTAGWFVALAISVAGLVGLVAGWWWVLAVVLMEGAIALAHVGIRAYRDRKADEAYI